MPLLLLLVSLDMAQDLPGTDSKIDDLTPCAAESASSLSVWRIGQHSHSGQRLAQEGSRLGERREATTRQEDSESKQIDPGR